jgi:hypothetical protein
MLFDDEIKEFEHFVTSLVLSVGCECAQIQRFLSVCQSDLIRLADEKCF